MEVFLHERRICNIQSVRSPEETHRDVCTEVQPISISLYYKLYFVLSNQSGKNQKSDDDFREIKTPKKEVKISKKKTTVRPDGKRDCGYLGMVFGHRVTGVPRPRQTTKPKDKRTIIPRDVNGCFGQLDKANKTRYFRKQLPREFDRHVPTRATQYFRSGYRHCAHSNRFALEYRTRKATDLIFICANSQARRADPTLYYCANVNGFSLIFFDFSIALS
jgi:hypothetical protein